jgi:hypothetical protein
MSKTSKITLISVGVIFLILALIVVQFRGSREEPSTITQPEVPVNAIREFRISASAAASELTKFVESTINEKTGLFYVGYECDRVAGACVVDESTSTPHFGYSIMSLAREQAKSPHLKEKADKMISTVVERCQTDREYCEWNFFPLYEYYTATGEQKYLDAMVSVGEYLLGQEGQEGLYGSNIPVKWWRLYELTGDQRYRDALLRVANEVLSTNMSFLVNDSKAIYETPEMTVYEDMFEVVWAMMYPAYKVSGDTRYLAYAHDYIEKSNIIDNWSKVWLSDGRPGSLTIVKVMETMLWLSQSDQKYQELYTQQLVLLSEQVLASFWDHPERKMINADYGIMTRRNYKTTNTNAWYAVVLKDLGERELVIKFQ